MKNILKRSTAFAVILALCFTFMAAFATTEAQAASKTHLKKTTITMLRGETYQQKLLTSSNKIINSSNVKWSSNNSKIAKISKTGKVTAVKTGKTTLKAVYKGKTYKFKVDVKKGILCGPAEQIMVGKACWCVDLERKDRDDGYYSQAVPISKIKFRSSDSDVLTFEKKGKEVWIKGVSEGNAILYATYCGVKYKLKIEVQEHTLNNFEVKEYNGKVLCCFDSNDDWNVWYKVIEGKELIENNDTDYVKEEGMCYSIDLNRSATGQIKIKMYSRYDSTINHTYVINVRDGKLVGENDKPSGGSETTTPVAPNAPSVTIKGVNAPFTYSYGGDSIKLLDAKAEIHRLYDDRYEITLNASAEALTNIGVIHLYYRVLDSEGFIVDDGHVRFPEMMAGGKAKGEANGYVEGKDNYAVEFYAKNGGSIY